MTFWLVVDSSGYIADTHPQVPQALEGITRADSVGRALPTVWPRVWGAIGTKLLEVRDSGQPKSLVLNFQGQAWTVLMEPVLASAEPWLWASEPTDLRGVRVFVTRGDLGGSAGRVPRDALNYRQPMSLALRTWELVRNLPTDGGLL